MENDVEILIVEDEVLSAMSIQQDLKRSGYSLSSYVTSGEAALSRININKPSLIIMDISLAGELSGIDTAEIILSEHEIPVILSSGYSFEDLRSKIDHLENVYFLKKPLIKSELITMVKKILS